MNSEWGRATTALEMLAAPFGIVRTAFRAGWPPRFVPPFSFKVSFGLKPSAEQPPTWKGALTPALPPSADATDPVIVIGSQEVGLRVNCGRPICRVIWRRSSGIPSRIWGKGSETAWIWPVVGFR